MPLTLEEEQELQALETQQSELNKEYEALKQELNPPEIEELPETSMTEAAVRGAAQGLTFDTADEMGARVESWLTGKPYDKALKESRAEYKASEEEYPLTSIAGQLAGGIGQAVGVGALTGGTGAVGGVAQAGSKLGKLQQLVRSTFLPSAGASSLKNIATAAKTSAVMGGLTSVGASEKEGLERLEGVPGAALTSGVLGGALGGVVEGVKAGAGAVGSKLSKMAEAGELPYSIRKVMDVYKAGKPREITVKRGDTLEDILNRYGTNVQELTRLNGPLDEIAEGTVLIVPGQGYVQERSLRAVDTQLEDASEEAVQTIQQNVDDIRNIKKFVLNQTEKRVPAVLATLQDLKSNLENKVVENLADATPALKRVEGLISTLKDVDEQGAISAIAADNIVDQLDDYRLAPELSSEVKQLFVNTARNIKTNLRASVNKEDTFNALQNDPEMYNLYKRYLGALPEDEILKSKELSVQEQEEAVNFMKKLKQQYSKLQKKKTPEILKEDQKLINKQMGALKRTKDKTPKSLEDLELEEADIAMLSEEIANIMQEKAALNPLGMMDAMMHNILNASENLGGITRGRTSELKRVFKVLETLRSSAADTASGQKALMKYRKAVEDLGKANPELAKTFENIVKPAVTSLENKRFLEGAKLGESPREIGLLRSFISAPGQVLGFAANVAAQTKAPRPGLAGVMYMKESVDRRLQEYPDSALYSYFSKMLQNAVDVKDEGRRAAILNTLNQYKSFREMFKDQEE